MNVETRAISTSSLLDWKRAKKWKRRYTVGSQATPLDSSYHCPLLHRLPGIVTSFPVLELVKHILISGSLPLLVSLPETFSRYSLILIPHISAQMSVTLGRLSWLPSLNSSASSLSIPLLCIIFLSSNYTLAYYAFKECLSLYQTTCSSRASRMRVAMTLHPP